MAKLKIAVVNKSSEPNASIKPLVKALKRQVHQDFSPHWGIDADLVFAHAGRNPPPGSWLLEIMDNPDDPKDPNQQDAFGCHERTSSGTPVAKVFLKPSKVGGVDWTVVASHELLEMVVNPGIDRIAVVDAPPAAPGSIGKTQGAFYAVEVCDPCVGSGVYAIDGVKVANFVTPAFFDSFLAKSGAKAKFDHRGVVRNAFDPVGKGYIVQFTAGRGWRLIGPGGKAQSLSTPHVDFHVPGSGR